jgi:hypothetical protein
VTSIESSGNPERRERQPIENAPLLDGSSLLHHPHAENAAIRDHIGAGEITSPENDDIIAQPEPTATPGLLPVASHVGDLGLHKTYAETTIGISLPVRLRQLPHKQADEHTSEASQLPPDETISPAEADALFEVMSGNEPNPEVVARAGVLRTSGALDWISNGQSRLPIDVLIGADDSQILSDAPLTDEALTKMTGIQFADLAANITGIEDAIRATEALRESVFLDTYHPLVDRQRVVEVTPGLGYYAGQFTVEQHDDTITVTEQHVRAATSRPPTLMAHSPEAGVVHLIHPNSEERYVITGQDGTPHVMHERLRNLQPDDAGYLTMLRTMLITHRNLLYRVASDAGVDPLIQFDLTTGMTNRNDQARQEINTKVQHLLSAHGPAPALHAEIKATTAILHEITCTRRTADSTTKRINVTGLRSTGARIRAYYDTALANKIV